MKKLLVIGALSMISVLGAACVSAESPVGSTPTEEEALVASLTPTTARSITETLVPDTPTPEPPVQFSLVGSLGDLGSVVDVHVAGEYAYLADSFGGLQVVDISNPSQPIQVSAYESPGSTRGQGVFVEGPILYLADGQGVRILDVSDPPTPEVLGFYDTLGFALDLQIVGDLAYVAAREGGFYIANFADPADPQPISRMFDAGTDHVLEVRVSGGYAYVAMEGQGLKVIDVRNPESPVELGALDTDGTAEAIAQVGQFLYLADGESGVRIIDVADPANPSDIGGYDTPGYAQDVEWTDGYLFVADGDSGYLIVLDVSDPTEPGFVTQFEASRFIWDVSVSGSHAYLSLGPLGLVVVGIEAR